jgi:hypothetical protein
MSALNNAERHDKKDHVRVLKVALKSDDIFCPKMVQLPGKADMNHTCRVVAKPLECLPCT